jgi:predicted hotdog family 3-hydroxylacyl-ACP dehydratase
LCINGKFEMLIHDRAWIAARIPHQGDMCLLDAVHEWDEQSARCSASSHRAPNNPLRHNGRLGAACSIEYAAQAMAVHAALLMESAAAAALLIESAAAAALLIERAAAQLFENTATAAPPSESTARTTQRPTAGYLTSARAVQLHVARLDDIDADLDIEVERLSDAQTSVLYRFSVSAGGKLLATGRAAVVLDALSLPAATLNAQIATAGSAP